MEYLENNLKKLTIQNHSNLCKSLLNVCTSCLPGWKIQKMRYSKSNTLETIRKLGEVSGLLRNYWQGGVCPTDSCFPSQLSLGHPAVRHLVGCVLEHAGQQQTQIAVTTRECCVVSLYGVRKQQTKCSRDINFLACFICD